MTAEVAKMEWGSRYQKRFVDRAVTEVMYPWLSQHLRPRILSMPASSWHWEKTLSEDIPTSHIHFQGVERDPMVYSRMAAKARDLTLETPSVFRPYFGELSTYLQTERPMPFDVVYLDCMGTWGYDKLNWCDDIFKDNLLNPGGYLRLTVSANRGWTKHWESELDATPIHEYEFRVTNLRQFGRPIANWRIYGIPKIIKHHAELRGHNLLPLSCTIYHSLNGLTGKNTAMMSFLFKNT